MTPSERDRRIEAAARVLIQGGHPYDQSRARERAARILDAADEAVPMVSEAEHERLRERISQLEAAARAVLPILGIGPASEFPSGPYRAMTRLCVLLDESVPSFSGEEGTD